MMDASSYAGMRTCQTLFSDGLSLHLRVLKHALLAAKMTKFGTKYSADRVHPHLRQRQTTAFFLNRRRLKSRELVSREPLLYAKRCLVARNIKHPHHATKILSLNRVRTFAPRGIVCRVTAYICSTLFLVTECARSHSLVSIALELPAFTAC